MIHFIFKTIFIFFVFYGCKLKTESLDKRILTAESSSSALDLVSVSDIKLKPQLHAIQLDQAEFKVLGMRVNLLSFIQYQTPIIAFNPVELADFYQIKRCPSNVIINGGHDVLKYVELGAKDLAEETEVFQRNLFWEAMNDIPGCVTIVDSLVNTLAPDMEAPTGGFIYYVRACVEKSRLLGTDYFSDYNCSKFVSRSDELTFINNRKLDQLKQLEKLNNLEGEIYTLDRQILQLNKSINSAIFGCQQRSETPVISHSQKVSIGMLTGVGAAGGIAALTIGVTAMQKKDVLNNFRTKSALGKTLGVGIAAGVAGGAIGYIVSNLLNNASEPIPGYPTAADGSCYGKNESALITQWLDKSYSAAENKDKLNTLCACSDALSLKIQLKINTERLYGLFLQHNSMLKILGETPAENIPPSIEDFQKSVTQDAQAPTH